MVSLLISHGADTNAQNSSQRTALHVAVACDATDAAVYMLENGARMDIKDEWGSSPLECARNPAMRQLLQPYAVRPRPLPYPRRMGPLLVSSSAANYKLDACRRLKVTSGVSARTQADPAALAQQPIPQPAPAPESERTDAPVDDLAATQMRMLVVGEVLAEEAEAQAEAEAEPEAPEVRPPPLTHHPLAAASDCAVRSGGWRGGAGGAAGSGRSHRPARSRRAGGAPTLDD